MGTPVASDLVKEADRVTAHNVRVENGLWALFGRRVAMLSQTRTSVLVQFVKWYCRVPGAKLPQRPDPE